MEAPMDDKVIYHGHIEVGDDITDIDITVQKGYSSLVVINVSAYSQRTEFYLSIDTAEKLAKEILAATTSVDPKGST
jgi:hypothetical protein